MTFCLRYVVESLDETYSLARKVSSILLNLDVIALHGDLGVGKTEFVRALIHAFVLPGETVEVISPTFSLLQSYNFPDMCVSHFDFYRINDPSELEELGFADALASSLLLIEWPERIGDLLPENRLDIFISTDDEGRRFFLLEGKADWEHRLRRIDTI